MVLPSRPEGDRFAAISSYEVARNKILAYSPAHIGIVIYNAFDWRTRVGPFTGPDLYIANLGVRSVATALYDSGFKATRVVLGNWNKNIDLSKAKLDGKIPQVVGIGSMQINSADANNKIRQLHTMGDSRPLIIGGGPHANYEYWKYFHIGGDSSIGADAAVRGEEHVTLELMARILDYKSRKEDMKSGFRRARREGVLDSIPGIVYISEDNSHLVYTGEPRLLPNFDILPREIIGLGLLEPKHNKETLSSMPVPIEGLKRNGLRILSLRLASGCSLRCDYCPIPNQAQFTLRVKSIERFIDDIEEIHYKTGISTFFGTSDNIASEKKNLEMLAGVASRGWKNKGIRLGDEVTETQLYKQKELLPDLGQVFGALWFGIEDLTSGLVRKGVTPQKTSELFPLLVKNDIWPMPMMMHYDGQPLKSPPGTLVGLLNQIEFLQKLGAKSIQVTYLIPSTGAPNEASLYEQGMVFSRIGNLNIDDYLFDGNHVVATSESNPLERMTNIVKAYESFYNLRSALNEALDAVLKGENPFSYNPFRFQLIGMAGILISKKNLKHFINELKRAIPAGDYEKHNSPPKSILPVIDVSQKNNEQARLNRQELFNQPKEDYNPVVSTILQAF